MSEVQTQHECFQNAPSNEMIHRGMRELSRNEKSWSGKNVRQCRQFIVKIFLLNLTTNWCVINENHVATPKKPVKTPLKRSSFYLLRRCLNDVYLMFGAQSKT